MSQYPHYELIFNAIKSCFATLTPPLTYETFVSVINSNSSNFGQFVLTINKINSGMKEEEDQLLVKLIECYMTLFYPVINYVSSTYKVNLNLEQISYNFAVIPSYTEQIIMACSVSSGKAVQQPIASTIDNSPDSYSILYPQTSTCMWQIQRRDRDKENELCGGDCITIVYLGQEYPVDYCKQCVSKKKKAQRHVTNVYPMFDIDIIIEKLKNKTRRRKAIGKAKIPKKGTKVVDRRTERILPIPLKKGKWFYLEEIGYAARASSETNEMIVVGKVVDRDTMETVRVIPLTVEDVGIINGFGYKYDMNVDPTEFAIITDLLFNKSSTTYVIEKSDCSEIQDESAFLRYHVTFIHG